MSDSKNIVLQLQLYMYNRSLETTVKYNNLLTCVYEKRRKFCVTFNSFVTMYLQFWQNMTCVEILLKTISEDRMLFDLYSTLFTNAWYV